MRKISYRPIYNRKNQLNTQGKALLQIEAYLEKEKNLFFHAHLFDSRTMGRQEKDDKTTS